MVEDTRVNHTLLLLESGAGTKQVKGCMVILSTRVLSGALDFPATSSYPAVYTRTGIFQAGFHAIPRATAATASE